jgi:hypothetical protein
LADAGRASLDRRLAAGRPAGQPKKKGRTGAGSIEAQFSIILFRK